MSSIIKSVTIGMIVLMFFSLVGTRVQTVTNRQAEDELSYALRVATQDATSVLVDRNHMMDGKEGDTGNFRVNLDTAEKQFRKSFAKNIGSCVSPSAVNSMNIPLSGYAGYRCIVGRLIDGRETFPYAYTYVDANQIYNFTMGDTVYVTDVSNGTETTISLSGLAEHFFDADITNENFRTITIMNAISAFLSDFMSDTNNLMVLNTGSGLTFTLGGVDYTNVDPSQITQFSAVIDGPGYFAVTDLYDTQLGGRIRTFTFGGAEFISKYR